MSKVLVVISIVAELKLERGRGRGSKAAEVHERNVQRIQDFSSHFSSKLEELTTDDASKLAKYDYDMRVVE